MKMVTKVAYDNMKYYKSRNILIGIAILLTSMLLFVIPTLGKAMIGLQSESVNRLYPSWHALFRNIPEETVTQLKAHHGISRYGLRSDVGILNEKEASVSLMFLDQEGLDLYNMKVEEGRLPEKSDEILLSREMLKTLGLTGEIGDPVTFPVQIRRNGGLDLTEERKFTICGFLPDAQTEQKEKKYTALVSQEFLREEVPGDQIRYYFLFQILAHSGAVTDNIEREILKIGEQFGIKESQTGINKEYLGANYVDPATVPVICGIMLVIVIAGIITIYSIYYVSLHQRIREFGRLKAIGASKGQMRQIILREGLWVSVIAVPAGLLCGTGASWLLAHAGGHFLQEENEYIKMLKLLIREDRVPLFHWWIYLLAAGVTIGAVWISMLKPMHMASRVTVVEAIRSFDARTKSKGKRKGHTDLTLGRLTWRNLMENRRKTIVTIVSMSLTGGFLMVVATVLSCAHPKESADSSILGSYQIYPIMEEGNKEHPEWAWKYILKDNPLTEELKGQIQGLPGVERVDTFSALDFTCGQLDPDSTESISGVPDVYAEKLEKGIIKGKATYEELKSGDKIVIDRAVLYWYPQLELGDKLKISVQDGDHTFEKELEIIAIGEYESGMADVSAFFMAKEAVDRLSQYNCGRTFQIIADKRYDAGLESSLKELVAGSGRLEMQTWQEEYEHWKEALSATSMACYLFLAVLAAICVMNLINTMINNVNARRQELGMMQAVGMSDRQLREMLWMEGMFYTLGTLIISVGGGSLLGYPVFLHAKSTGMFSITAYHYPFAAAVTVAASLFLIQLLLGAALARSVKKDSLIDRIRYNG